jgi:DnaJ-class molecular chaperone
MPKEVQIEAWIPCDVCGGTGTLPVQPGVAMTSGAEGQICQDCEGKGAIRRRLPLSELARMLHLLG